MKKLIGLLALLASSAWAQQSPPYPAGIWTADVVNPGTPNSNGDTEDVTLYVLPNGTYWGQIVITPGNNNCIYLIQGNLVKGGVDLTESQISEYDGLPMGAGCTNKPSTFGNATITRLGADRAKFVLNDSLLTRTYVLTP